MATGVAIGVGVQVIGGIISARGQRKAAKSRAQALRVQAANIRRESIDRINDLEEKENTVSGTQRAAFARRGVKLNFGSPLVLLAETNRRGKRARERVKRSADAAVAALLSGASAARKAGDTAALGTLVSTVGSGAVSLGQAFKGFGDEGEDKP